MSESYEQQIDQLNRRGSQLYQEGRYKQAMKLGSQACDLARQHLGEDHLTYALSLNNLAEAYRAMGNYAAAEPLFRQAVEIHRATLRQDDSRLAVCLHNLAALFRDMGNYTDAEELLRESLETLRTTLGEQHPYYVGALSNLATLYEGMGNWARAELLRRQAVELFRTTVGEHHPYYAATLSNLAGSYWLRGDYSRAETLYLRAIKIKRAVLGENHPGYAESLKGLALLYQDVRNYAEAEVLGRKVIEIAGATLGKHHPHYASSLNDLALLYDRMGKWAQAELLFQQAIEITRTTLGTNHPENAVGLDNLASLYLKVGDYARAEPFYRRAIEVGRTAWGEYHPEYAVILSNLACLCIATDRVSEGFALQQESVRINDRMIGQVFSVGSDSHRTAYLKVVQCQLSGFLSFVLRHVADSDAAIRAALELVLRRKALGSEALAVPRDAVLRGKYPNLEPQLRQVTTLRMQLAQKTLAGPGKEGLQEYQQRLAEWNGQKERVEAELARQIPEMNLEQKLRAADRQAVALSLPEGVALVEFVRFDVFDFKALPARGEPRLKPARYLAFVLPAGEPDNVTMIDLGEAKPIDRMIADFRAGVVGEGQKRDMEAVATEPTSLSADSAGAALRAAVFDPLLAPLGDCRRLLFAPDGDLTRLPFEVLPTIGGGRLIDDYQISYIAVGRDVLRFGAKTTRRLAPPVIVADPDFDLEAAGTARQESPAPSRQSRDLDRSRRFKRLPGTRTEGQHIANMLGVEPWLEADALEGQLKRVHSPRILHLATHGFFLEDQEQDPAERFRDFGAIRFGRGGDMERLSAVRIENPLLRSGLALAGVNTWLKGGEPASDAQDGILTAEDVTGLDLLDTELVVLSACETGLGEVQIGEGVMGLRRSFIIAGAKTLVMSLWKVPDQQTRELMDDFYRRILAGEPRAEALRQAQLTMKAKYPHPYYWGALICQGEPGDIKVRQRGMTRESGDKQQRLRLGVDLIEQGRTDEALEVLRDLASTYPDFYDAHNYLGVALCKNGVPDEALDEFKTAILINPYIKDAIFNFRVAERLKIQADLGVNADDYRTGRRSIGLEDYVTSPFITKGYSPEKYAYVITGQRVPSPMRQARLSLKKLSRHEQRLYDSGVELRAKGEPEKAIERFRKLLESKAEFADAHNDIGASYMDMGRIEEAMEYFRRALELDRYVHHAHENLGRALLVRDRVEEAIGEFSSELELEPLDLDSKYMLGVAFLKTGRSAEAIVEWAELLTVSANYEFKQDILQMIRDIQGRHAAK